MVHFAAAIYSAGFAQGGITLPQVTEAQERQLLGFGAALFLAGTSAVALHALSLVTAFS